MRDICIAISVITAAPSGNHHAGDFFVPHWCGDDSFSHPPCASSVTIVSKILPHFMHF